MRRAAVTAAGLSPFVAGWLAAWWLAPYVAEEVRHHLRVVPTQNYPLLVLVYLCAGSSVLLGAFAAIQQLGTMAAGAAARRLGVSR